MDSIRPIRFYKVSGTKILAVDTLSLRVRSSHHGWDLVPQRLDWIEIEERWHWGISLSWRSVPLGDINIMKTCTYSTVMFEEHFKPTSTWMDFSAEHFPEHHNLSTDFLASHNASWCHHYPHDGNHWTRWPRAVFLIWNHAASYTAEWDALCAVSI